MNKLRYFVIFFIISCSNETNLIKVDEQELAMDVDRLCAIVTSTPEFQARGEYVKGYYQILDKYGLSQDSEIIQATFDGMTDILAIGSFCEVATIASIMQAVNPDKSLNTEKVSPNLEEIEKQREVKIKEVKIPDDEQFYEEYLNPIKELALNDPKLKNLGFIVAHFFDDGCVIQILEDGIAIPLKPSEEFEGYILKEANDKMAIFSDEGGQDYVFYNPHMFNKYEEPSIRVNRPSYTSEIPENAAIPIVIGPSGEISINGRRIDIKQLKENVAKMIDDNPQLKYVVVSPDTKTSADDIVRVLDIINETGVLNVSLQIEE